MPNKSFQLIILICVTLVLLMSAPTTADSFNYPSFPNSNNLKLNGYGSFLYPDWHIVRMTNTVGNKCASLFYTKPVDIRSFETTFNIRMWISSYPGDGMTFVIHNDPRGTSALGSNGGGLGYEGISRSVALEFDNFTNYQHNDPDPNHIGIDKNGSMTSLKTTNYEVFDAPVYVRVRYENGIMKMFASRTSMPSATGTPILTYAIDIPSIVGQSTAYIGFTAGTGVCEQCQDVYSWSYNTLSVPEPSTILGLICGFAGLAAFRPKRRRNVTK